MLARVIATVNVTKPNRRLPLKNRVSDSVGSVKHFSNTPNVHSEEPAIWPQRSPETVGSGGTVQCLERREETTSLNSGTAGMVPARRQITVV